MSTSALLLVLASACCHSTWNLLLRRSAHKPAFLCSLMAVGWVIFLVPTAVVLALDGLPAAGLAFGVATAVLHGGYAVALARGYQIGDLSSMYPISRGMGPALVPLLALVLLDENVSSVAGLGIALVVAGVYVISVDWDGSAGLLRPLRTLGRADTRIAVLTGGLIASYSLVDKAALDHISPLALNQFAMAGSVIVLTTLAFAGGGMPLRAEWRQSSRAILVAGLLAPLGYLLVLVALTTSRIAYVAPTREVGIVISAVIGVAYLGEGYGPYRLAGAMLILVGVITLGVAP